MRVSIFWNWPNSEQSCLKFRFWRQIESQNNFYMYILDRYVIVMIRDNYEVTNNMKYLLFHFWTVFGAKKK